MWQTKVANGAMVCVIVPPGTYTKPQRFFIKPGIARGGNGKILTIGIDAPMELDIERDPSSVTQGFWPDGGAGNRKAGAELSRHQTAEKEAEAVRKAKLEQDAKHEKEA